MSTPSSPQEEAPISPEVEEAPSSAKDLKISDEHTSSRPIFPVAPTPKEPDSHKEIKVDETYDYLPQDYTLTDHDLCAHIAIESSFRKQLLVQIDGSSVLQHQLMCLLDEKEWVNDDVINACICCIKDQIHLQNDNKVYFESPFVTSLFKRDGTIGIQEDSAFMTETVLEYMQPDMLRGIQFHLDLLKSQKLMATDFGRHPDFRKKLDVEQLAKSVRSWPGIKYNVSTCKSIQEQYTFWTLLLLIQYTEQPTRKIFEKIIWINEHLPKAMSKACPGSRWNEDILLWHHKILDDIPVYNRELSGYLVPLFMSTWEDERPHLPFLKGAQSVEGDLSERILAANN
ncbi:hypothetical protein TRIUR3_21782 [Triticum urartu]|uniref:Uncharacterized protein n=1 Tax=Triticum urartu TaxID=4572 RepID=M7Y8Q8_TRIUA|nr:hypothetical protein TRIUR3_21782 [Triticum urartu]